MPRIDPIQLLKCLSVLLSPNGGIRSNEEVYRLASLMTKFSKKLVSKCIYIQILKCTETELLGSFMGSGGWRLAHMWLTESIIAKNWPLVRELLELLLLCPVDIDRLKTNNCPKLVKELSKDGSQTAIRALAAKLVEQWLKTVKGEPVIPVKESDFLQIISEGSVYIGNELVKNDSISERINDKVGPKSMNDESCQVKEEIFDKKTPVDNDSLLPGVKKESVEEDATKENQALPVLKISLKDGKQVISKLDHVEEKTNEKVSTDKNIEHKSSKSRSKGDDSKTSRSSSKHSRKIKSHSSKSSSENHRSSSSSSKSGHSSSSSKDKQKESRHSSSSDKQKDKKSNDKFHSSNSHKSKDEKYKSEKCHKSDKSREDRNHKGKDKILSEKHKDGSEKPKESNEKSKDLFAKMQNPIKLMKIPKLSETKKEAPSISIESRRPNDPNRPKTVKTFNSKFRSHGLEEEIKPPPPRGSVLKKTLPVIPPAVSIPKRPSPPHIVEQPPEKRSKIIEPPEKPGSIKLIPAKPKPAMLLESDMFMDALNASATNKKEPKKRKRRISGSKDGNPGTDASPPTTPTAAPSAASPNHEAKSTPFRFYKDTLETDEEKDKEPVKDDDEEPMEMKEAILEPVKDELIEESEHVKTAPNGLRGVLCYHKRKGPKKSIRWRPDTELEQIQYFELDETERVNVSKTFSDMKNLERVHEREAVQKARNLLNDDVMEVKTTWRPLIPVDIGSAIIVDYGKNSKEKEIQASRQKSVLQSIYLKTMTPDSPSEPDLESHPPSEPTIMPLDDITGNPDTVSDFRNTPWPEPKGSLSSTSVNTSNIGVTPMFPPMTQFPGPFPNAQFGMPGYQGPPPPGMGLPAPDWASNMPPPNAMVPGGMPPGPMTQGPGPIPPPMLIHPNNLPPGVMMPPESMVGPPDGMFGGPNPMFPMPPEGFNMNIPPNMFPPGFTNGMPENGGSFMYGNRGGIKGRGASNQWRGGWDGSNRGRGGWKKAKCIHFAKKGSCRQGDSCAFQHPGVNCPY